MKIRNILLLSLFIFVLNLIWEFNHYHLYVDLTGIPVVPHLFLASFVDVLLVFVVIFFVSVLNKNIRWIDEMVSLKNYTLFFFIGIFLAFFWELFNIRIGRWEYTLKMPIIFGVGMSPLLQLSITGMVALNIYSYIIKKEGQ